MGLMRFVWRSTLLGRTIDTVKNVVEERSVIDGVKRTVKEDVCEDNPIGRAIYNTGSYDGKKVGYSRASAEYEKKLLEQADLFLKQQRDYQFERDEYEDLLSQYEAEIELLEDKVNKSESENEYLQELLLRERKLRKLAEDGVFDMNVVTSAHPTDTEDEVEKLKTTDTRSTTKVVKIKDDGAWRGKYNTPAPEPGCDPYDEIFKIFKR